jgi:ankyrin repeat protein
MSFTDIKKAIKKDKLKDVKKLVKADLAIVNIENSDGETPLFVAFHEENTDIAKYLIDNGADINHKSRKDGWTVLHVACYLKNMEMFNLLLDNYVDIEATSNTGATPLYLVCKHGSHNDISIDIIKALLLADIGDDEEDKYINKKAERGYFPLYIASKNGDEDIVELLLAYSANVSEKSDDGTTALMIAVQANQDNSHLELIKMLLEAGADLEIEDNEDNNALFYAQQNGDAEVIELLMQYAPDSPTPSLSSRSSSKSKSFSVGSVEPAVLDTISIKQSKIPETAEDFVNLEDVNIANFLAESDKNRIIKAHNSFYALSGEDIKTHFLSGNQKNNYVYYPCKRALPPPALGVSKNDVHMDKPLFSASYLVGVLSDFVLLSEVMAMLEAETQYFEIITMSDVQNVPATASAQMFTSNRNAVSANHCQEGKGAKILKLKMLDIVEDSVASKSAEAKGTRRRNKKHKSAKRAKQHKRQTLRTPMKSRKNILLI